jgi:hypothetical protein
MAEIIGRVPELLTDRLIEPEATQSKKADTLLRESLDSSGYPGHTYT